MELANCCDSKVWKTGKIASFGYSVAEQRFNINWPMAVVGRNKDPEVGPEMFRNKFNRF